MIILYAYHYYLKHLEMSTNLRFIVSHGRDIVHMDDDWTWRGNKITSLLVPSDITIILVRLMENLRMHDPTPQTEMKFKVSNTNILSVEIGEN